MSRFKKIRLTVGIVLGMAVIAFIAVVTVGAVRINREYPQPEVHMAAIDEPLQMGDFEIRAKDFDLYTRDEFLQQYPDVPADILDYNASADDFRIATAVLSFKNVGSETKLVPTDSAAISTTTWTNGVDIRILMYLDEYPISPTLAPGEEATVLLPCTLVKSHVPKEMWEHLDEQQFRVTFTLYPEIYGIRLTP